MKKIEDILNLIKVDLDKLVIEEDLYGIYTKINNIKIRLSVDSFRGVYEIGTTDKKYFMFETDSLKEVLDFLEYLCNY